MVARSIRSRWPVSAVMLGLLCAILLTPAHHVRAADNYRANADAAMAKLQQWYSNDSGIWNTTGWWNSANALESVIDYSRSTNTTTYRYMIGNTFDKARYSYAGNFINDYYDDNAWWALTWIKAYDLTGESRYLNMAKTIFADMTGGWTNECGGGIKWSKSEPYFWGTKNAIANGLMIQVAIRLHQRAPNDAAVAGYTYHQWADRTWSWFQNSGMINSNSLVNDGLNNNCQNNGYPTYTYNQGVIVGALTDLYRVTNNQAYLTKAQAIADATISRVIYPNGVLKEPCEPDCGNDGPSFKGIFMKNLSALNDVQFRTSYRDFFIKNADSLWANSRNGNNEIGEEWTGPYDYGNAARQHSAVDTLNAALPYSVSSPTPSFYDDFEDGNSDGWTGNNFSVCQPPPHSKEFCKSGTSEGVTLAGNTSWANYAVQSYVLLESESSTVGLLGRVQDANRFYQLELKKNGNNRVWAIWKNNNGAWNQIAEGPYNWSINTYYLLRLTVNGSTLSASISTNNGANFASLGSGNDSTFGTGKIGLRATNGPARFDVVRVTGN